MTHETTDLVSALRAALARSLRARDKGATAALRAALADLANAESVPIEQGTYSATCDQHIAGSSPGLGAAEAPRRLVDEAEARDIVEQELAARRTSALLLRRQGRMDEAADLDRGADVLQATLGSSSA